MFVDRQAFDAGVEGLIGRADPNTRAAIKAEHCLSEDSMDPFQTINTGIMTTSYREYWIVTGPEYDDDDAPEDMPEPDPGEEQKRSIVPLRDLLEMGDCKKAGLMWEEILALRLYSGPMYMKYNSLLRGLPHDMLQKLKGNKYTTTIHLILSGILKLSKVQRIPQDRLVYRGLGGRKLPKMFYMRDESGCRGGVEAGFMSTTTSKQVALKYSGVGQLPENLQTRNNIIFEIELGKMSMGADIKEVSQYPGESEILFTPLTHLEIVGKPKYEQEPYEDKVMRVFVVRLRATTNQKSLTLDQLLVERKTMLLDLGKKLVNQCTQLIGSGAQQGKSFALEVTGSASSNIQTVSLIKDASKVKELEDHIKADIESVEATAFNDLVIYQDTMRRLFEVFITACRGTAEHFAESVLPGTLSTDPSKLGVMILSCVASMHLMDKVPEDEKLLTSLAAMKQALIKLLGFKDKNRGDDSFRRQPSSEYFVSSKAPRARRSVRAMLTTAKLDLGRLQHKLSKYKEAMDSFRAVIDARTEMDGAETFGVLEAKECLGLVMYENRNLSEAMETFKSILEVRRGRVADDTDKDKRWELGVAEALCNMGRVHFRLSQLKGEGEDKERVNLDKAIELYSESLEMRRRVLTALHGAAFLDKDLAIAKLEEHLGAAHLGKGDPKTALARYQDALNIKKQALGPENLPIADILNLMGRPHLDMGQPKEALTLYKKSLNIKIRILGETHATIARSWSNIAQFHVKRKEFDLAVENFEKALKVNEEVYTHNHTHCAAVIELMIQTRRDQTGQEKEVQRLTSKLVGVLRGMFQPQRGADSDGHDQEEQGDSDEDIYNQDEDDKNGVGKEEEAVVWTVERFKTGCELCKRLSELGELLGKPDEPIQDEQRFQYEEALHVAEQLEVGESEIMKQQAPQGSHAGDAQESERRVQVEETQAKLTKLKGDLEGIKEHCHNRVEEYVNTRGLAIPPMAKPWNGRDS